MKSFLRLPAAAAAISIALVAAGCADEEARLVEPELDFPYTSANGSSPAPVTFDFGFGNDEDSDEDGEDDADDDENEDSDSDDSDNSDDSDDSDDKDEPAPAPRRNVRPAPAPVPTPNLPGSACAWPAQADAKPGEEFSTFCDREWARTVTSDGQQYFWEARGSGWVSIDPVSEHNGGVCWSKNDFEKAPEAIRNAVVFCDS